MKKDGKEKKIIWNRLFYNNKFAILFSVLVSIVLWAVLSSNNTQDRSHAITGVPVKVELSDSAQADGMKVFKQTDNTVTVYVKGNPLAVNQLKSSDLVAVASLPSNISMPGYYPLTLTVQNSNTGMNFGQYTVDSISPQQVWVDVDKYREKTFKIESKIVYKPGYQADNTYFVGEPTLSSDTVTISGPEQKVIQVNRVAYKYDVNDTLTETKKFTANLVLYDANGNEIEKGNLTINPEKVDVTIPVLPRKTFSLDAAFTNKPAGLNLDSSQVQITPANIEVAGPKDVLANLGKVSLNPIDFSSISPTHNSFDANISLPTTCKNLSNLPTATVTLNLSGLITKQMSVSSFNVKNLSSSRNAVVNTKNLSVTVVGPESEVLKLNDSNIVGSADMTGKENFTGQTEVPVTFTISNSTSCWVYGSYSANVNVS